MRSPSSRYRVNRAVSPFSLVPFDENSLQIPFDEVEEEIREQVVEDEDEEEEPDSDDSATMARRRRSEKHHEYQPQPKSQDWMSMLLAAKEEMKTAFLVAKFRDFDDCRSDTTTDYRNHADDERYRDSDRTNDNGGEDIDEREFHDTVSSAEENDSMVNALFEDTNVSGCVSAPAKCAMDLPDKEDFKRELFACQNACNSKADNSEGKSSNPEKQEDGIDFIFELVESALCGDFMACKRQTSERSPTRMKFDHLPVYKLPPNANVKESVSKHDTEEESIYSASGKSTHSAKSHRSASTRSRTSTSSRKKRSHAPKRRSRSSSQKVTSAEALPTNKDVAQSASAFIQQNVNAKQPQVTEAKIEPSPTPRTQNIKPSLKVSSPLKHDASSAFEDISTGKVHNSNTTVTTAVSSHITEAEASVTGLRELCVLSIGSGSAVSSFDQDTHSWSNHNKTESRTRTLTTIQRLRNLAAFLSSLLSTIEPSDSRPVNKAAYLIALVLAMLLWPSDQEKDRVHIERKVPPKQASLLTMVIKG